MADMIYDRLKRESFFMKSPNSNKNAFGSIFEFMNIEVLKIRRMQLFGKSRAVDVSPSMKDDLTKIAAVTIRYQNAKREFEAAEDEYKRLMYKHIDTL